MEHVKDQLCPGLPHFCSAGLQAPKAATTPEIKMPEHMTASTPGTKQKPWSVFGDLYWI